MALAGAGTKTNPYLVTSDADLRLVTNNKSAYYKQTADITMSTTAFTPIGDSTTAFTGSYDGGGYKIINLKINTTNNRVGLFGTVGGVDASTLVVIKNLELVNPSVTYTGTSLWVGALVGYTTGYTQIKNVTINGGTITATGATYVGGLIGQTNGSGITLTNVVTKNITVKGSDSVGGMIGTASYGTFDKVIALGNTVTSTVAGRAYGFTYFFDTNNVSFNNTGTDGTTSSNVSPPLGKRLYAISYPTDLAQYTSMANSNYNWTNWTFTGVDPFAMTQGSYPTITYVGETVNVPYQISTEAHLDLVRNNLGSYFKLMNDISVATSISSFLITGTFSGDFNGNGYSLKTLNCPSSSNSNISVFDSVSGSIYKLGIEWTQIQGSSTSSNVALIARYLMDGGSVTEVSAIVNGTCSANTINGFFTSTGTTGMNVQNCFGKCYFTVTSNQFNGTLRIFASAGTSYTNTTFKNNVMHMKNIIYNSSNQVYPFLNGSMSLTNSTFANNLYYIDGKDGTFINTNNVGGAERLSTLTDYQTATTYSSRTFDLTNIWKMANGDADPSLRAFIKIVIKIQTYTVTAYSRIVRSGISKGVLHNVLSFGKTIVSALSKQKKVDKTTTSFTNKVNALASKSSIMKRLKQATSFVKSVFSQTSRTSKSKKTKMSFTKKINANVTKNKKFTRTKTSFVSPIASSKVVKRFKNFVVNSFSKKISSSMLTKIKVKVESFVSPIVSSIYKFSNKFQFVAITVNSGVKAIVSNVSRSGSVTKQVVAYTKKIVSLANVFWKVATPKKYLAIITYKLSKIQLFKRESRTEIDKKKHMTKINISDDGGED